MYKLLVELPREAKALLFVAVDAVLAALCLYLAFTMRLGELWPSQFINPSWPLFPILPLLTIIVVIALRLHRMKLSAFETSGVVRIGYVAALLTLSVFAVSYLLRLPTPRSVPLIFGLLFFLGAIAVRIAILRLLDYLQDRENTRERVVIYGAGTAGIQLVAGLARSQELRAVAFVDDDPRMHGMTISGLPVLSPGALSGLVRRQGVSRILLALPTISRERRLELANALAGLGAEVQFLPAFAEMMAETSLVDSLRSLSPDDLLGRNAVDPSTPEVARTYHGRTVMITGAGGSIGSELSRQVLQCAPQRVVLFDLTEFALYQIERELRPEAEARGIELVAALGSVCDRARLDRLISDQSVDILVHAAAYKHVPLVEANALEGVRNNVLGTLTAAEAARDAGLERFIMISTDKAVRPTSVMGASKRLAEIAVQDAQTRAGGTKFALVRFGNVLGSSGSVIPLFKEQIEAGGPVTLTHSEVTRYFMTISEASGLVLLAGAYATGGDVFVLDMGKPVRIRDLAERMIGMSGKTLRDAANPGGDIEIREIGLRDGEKMYEELLIDEDMLPTPHEKILRAQEKFPSQIEVARILRSLRTALDAGDAPALRRVLSEVIDGFPQDGVQAAGGEPT